MVTTSKSKHGRKNRGNKFFSIVLVCAIITPTISKAATSESLVITIINRVAFEDKLILTCFIDNTKEENVIKYGDNASGITNPTKDGYTFIGWENEDGTTFDKNEPITKDTKITAIFNPVEYTISYELDGGTVSVDNLTKYTIESDDIQLNRPTKSGFEFKGWTGTDLSEKTKDVIIPKGSMGNRLYTANWEQVVYTIKLDANGGSVNPESIMVNKGDSIGTLPRPTIDGDYVFLGWYTNKNYSTKITENTKPTSDTTYYAKWVDRMETVYSLDGPVTFTGGGFIEGVPELADKRYIDTGIKLFDEENFGKDFEIGFTIIDTNFNTAQETIVNSKLEDASKKYPGFVFRRVSSSDNIELSSRANDVWVDGNKYKWPKQTNMEVIIYRIDNIVYISINGGEKIKYNSYDGIDTFDTPVTFGTSLNANGNPIRTLNGTLSNLYIKLENLAD